MWKLNSTSVSIFIREAQRRIRSRHVPCLVCGGDKSRLLYKLPNVRSAPFRYFFAEKIVQCTACNFVYTNPRLPTEALEEYYSERYKLEGLDVPKTREELLSDRYGDVWMGKSRELGLVMEHKRGGHFLDVGCASGSLLYLAREHGFSVQGVEVSPRSAKFVQEELGIDVFVGQLEEAGFRDASFDVVTCIHTLEHFPNPKVTLAEIHRILKEDGVLIGVVPNLASWTAQRNGADWKWLQPANHYSHFTPDALESLLASTGFASEFHSEEGRYGEEEVSALLSDDERQRLCEELRGSEIIFVGRKAPAATIQRRNQQVECGA